VIGPRVRVRPRCDDDYACPSPWAHPLLVAVATVALQAVGEIAVRRYLQDASDDAPKRKAKRRE
jgi:hypothetical protein